MPEAQRRPVFSVFQVNQSANYNRVGKQVWVKTQDGASNYSDTVEANLLLDILTELRKKK